MKKSFEKMQKGYKAFREKYALGNESVMDSLSLHGQKPEIMIVACCDSRVDPALILQCDPGDLFIVRNVANIVPPFEKDEAHHGTSAALEFGIRYLSIKHLILLGHSQCGGIQKLLAEESSHKDDFITHWVSLIKTQDTEHHQGDEYAKLGLQKSHQNCITFPWIRERIEQKKLTIHLWYFDIKKGEISTYSETKKGYEPLDSNSQF